MTEQALSIKEMKSRAGHQEILGETLAKFEFFSNRWHPYSRFLDVDKVDLVLRRRVGGRTIYRDIQVKFGKLYDCIRPWEQPLFSCSSWRFFTEKNLEGMTKHKDLFLTYVLSADGGFKGDLFIFPIEEFARVIRLSDRLANGSYRVYISRKHGNENRWFLRRKPRFTEINKETTVEVTHFYRNFACLEPTL